MARPSWKWLLLALVLPVGVFYFFVDPEAHPGVLACPFRALTGLLCPGCGSQRALHDLLHGRATEAFTHNALMVSALPLAGLQLGLARWPVTAPWLTPGRVAAFWALAALGWGILRNIPSSAGVAH
jgi:hypothetical protein